jgi:predicted Zn-dependent protease
LQNLPDDTRPRWLLARAYIETGKPWEAVRILNEKLGSQHWEPKHWEMLQLAQQSWGQMISRAR